MLEEHFDFPEIMLPARRSAFAALEQIEPQRPPGALHDYQEKVRASALKMLIDPDRRAFLVQMPTGAGKTRVMMEALTSHRLFLTDSRPTTVWLAHTEELCDQAVEAFGHVWGIRGDKPVTVVRFWGDARLELSDLRGTFIVASYQKLARAFERSPESFLALVDRGCVVVADEAHKALAPTIRPIIESSRSGHSVPLWA